MHLPGEADGIDLRAGLADGVDRGGDRAVDRFLGGAPPVFGVLLGPAGMGDAEGMMFARSRGDDLALFVHNYGARSAGANINSQERHFKSLFEVNAFSKAFSLLVCTGQSHEEWLFAGAKATTNVVALYAPEVKSSSATLD